MAIKTDNIMTCATKAEFLAKAYDEYYTSAADDIMDIINVITLHMEESTIIIEYSESFQFIGSSGTIYSISQINDLIIDSENDEILLNIIEDLKTNYAVAIQTAAGYKASIFPNVAERLTVYRDKIGSFFSDAYSTFSEMGSYMVSLLQSALNCSDFVRNMAINICTNATEDNPFNSNTPINEFIGSTPIFAAAVHQLKRDATLTLIKAGYQAIKYAALAVNPLLGFALSAGESIINFVDKTFVNPELYDAASGEAPSLSNLTCIGHFTYPYVALNNNEIEAIANKLGNRFKFSTVLGEVIVSFRKDAFIEYDTSTIFGKLASFCRNNNLDIPSSIHDATVKIAQFYNASLGDSIYANLRNSTNLSNDILNISDNLFVRNSRQIPYDVYIKPYSISQSIINKLNQYSIVANLHDGVLTLNFNDKISKIYDLLNEISTIGPSAYNVTSDSISESISNGFFYSKALLSLIFFLSDWQTVNGTSLDRAISYSYQEDGLSNNTQSVALSLSRVEYFPYAINIVLEVLRNKVNSSSAEFFPYITKDISWDTSTFKLKTRTEIINEVKNNIIASAAAIGTAIATVSAYKLIKKRATQSTLLVQGLQYKASSRLATGDTLDIDTAVRLTRAKRKAAIYNAALSGLRLPATLAASVSGGIAGAISGSELSSDVKLDRLYKAITGYEF